MRAHATPFRGEPAPSWVTQQASWLLIVFLLQVVSACNQAADADPAGIQSSARAERRSLAGVRVEVAVLRTSAASLTINLPGEVEPSRDARLASALGGFIEQVSVANGDAVRRGQVVAMVDGSSHAARQNQAKVELDTAKRELERAVLLGDALPRAQLDHARARHDAARAAYRSAAVATSRSVISAPFAGVVSDVNVEVGEVAPPGMPMMRVLQIDPAKITVSLSDRDVIAVTKGMKAEVTTDARLSMHQGEVGHVGSAADTQTRAFTAEIIVPNPDAVLRPGMIASVRIAAEVAREQIVVAQDWLVTRPNELGVFLEVDGVAKWRPVRVGPVVRDRVVILSGLNAGEALIITGHRDLKDGDALLVSRRGVCCRDGRVDFDSGESEPRAADALPRPRGSAAAKKGTTP